MTALVLRGDARETPRRPVAEVEQVPYRGVTTSGRPKRQDERMHHGGWNGSGYAYTSKRTTITGYACACPDAGAPARPAVVLDPFGGTGTTAHVAAALGRVGVSVDLSGDYSRLAAAPELQEARRRKVLGLDKPRPVPAGQIGLDFEEVAMAP